MIKRAILELARAEQRKPFGQVARELGLVGSFSGARPAACRGGRILQPVRWRIDRTSANRVLWAMQEPGSSTTVMSWI